MAAVIFCAILQIMSQEQIGKKLLENGFIHLHPFHILLP